MTMTTKTTGDCEMTPDLDAVRAMMEGVTAGPWELDGIAIAGSDPHAGDVCLMGEPAQYPGDTARMLSNHKANARFIAAARELVPALAAEVEANRATIAALEARVETLTGALQWCSGSPDFNEGGQAREGWLRVCAPLLKGETPDVC